MEQTIVIVIASLGDSALLWQCKTLIPGSQKNEFAKKTVFKNLEVSLPPKGAGG